ncbi:hypothetical protein [Maribacter sp. 2308TA10-17]|uniref:hypothetical protein n=1 Tax=Maribacter sp. 2308TA10-17 TaxID=3386276 RepID=UPI0039BCA522
MKVKFLFIFIVFSIISSCNKEDEKLTETPVSDDPLEETVIEDQEKPKLTVVGLTGVIEKISEISISIVDDSSVETMVTLGGEELASSTEKQFTFSLNPYGIAVGDTDFTVTSKDAGGNETIETFTLEIKHLLMTYEYGIDEDERNPEKWIFFNDLDGNSLTNFRAEVGLKKVYTNEKLVGDKVYYSIANYKSTVSGTHTSKNLLVTTNKVPLGESRFPILYEPSRRSDLSNTLELRINLIGEDDGYAKYWSEGSNYTVFTTGGGGNMAIFGVRHDATVPIYIRTPVLNSKGFFDGKKENYTYKIFSPQTGDIIIEINEEEFGRAEDNFVLSIPPHDAGSMNLRRFGYENNEALLANINHVIYETEEAENVMADYYDLPLLNDLNTYRNQLFYKKNGIGYFTQDFDNTINASIPNWTLISDINESSINITAQNSGVDFYRIKFIMNDISDNNNVKYMTWNYRVFGELDQEKTAPRLTIPTNILDEINEDFYRNTDNLQFTSVDAYDYDEYDGYEEVMNWFALIKSRLTQDKNTYKRVSFYNTDASGKSNSFSEDFSDGEVKE